MVPRSAIERILEAGVQAPSGDNSQPWSFRILPDGVEVIAHPERDHALFNIEARGTYLAIGALLENIAIASAAENLEPHFEYFPGGDVTARVRFTERAQKPHELHAAIPARHTHRGPYHADISDDVVAHLSAIHEGSCSVHVVTDARTIATVATTVTAMEESALRTRKLHKLFFGGILWKADHNDAGEPGLYIKTFEFPPPVQALFRVIRSWRAMRFFNRIGFPKLAAFANAATYKQSAALILCELSRTTPPDFLDAGRCMQRAWLMTTKAGLAAQPLAGLLYFAEYIRRTNDPEIDASVKQRALNAEKLITEALGNRHTTLAMMLRIGRAKHAASARAARKRPHII